MEKGNKNSIEELFRYFLEEKEVEPGEQLTHQFMSKLRHKEFLRFNFSRFNVWYLGAILTVAAVSGVLFLPGNKSNDPWDIHLNNTEITDSVSVKGSSLITTEKSDSVISDAPQKINIKSKGKIDSDISESVIKHEEKVITSDKNEGSHTSIGRTDSNSVNESSLLVARISASVNQGCVPLHIKFSNGSTAGTESLWNFGDGGESEEREPEWIFNVAGAYRVKLFVRDENGHSAFTSLIINVWPKPESAFDILPDDPNIPVDAITFVNNSLGASSYKWHFGDGVTSSDVAPVHKYEKTGKYNVSLVAVSEFGCVDSLSISDAFSDTGCYLRFPNAFTPNSGGPVGGYYSALTDNANIVFHPVSSGVIKFNLKIYSKQGYLVFESDDVYLGWDGYYKGQLCAPGVYIWKTEGKFRDGGSYVMSGDVTLVNY